MVCRAEKVQQRRPGCTPLLGAPLASLASASSCLRFCHPRRQRLGDWIVHESRARTRVIGSRSPGRRPGNGCAFLGAAPRDCAAPSSSSRTDLALQQAVPKCDHSDTKLARGHSARFHAAARAPRPVRIRALGSRHLPDRKLVRFAVRPSGKCSSMADRLRRPWRCGLEFNWQE